MMAATTLLVYKFQDLGSLMALNIHCFVEKKKEKKNLWESYGLNGIKGVCEKLVYFWETGQCCLKKYLMIT